MGVRGDGGDTISPSTPREVLLALERCEINFFVFAPLFLVSAGHPTSRGVNIEFRRRSEHSTTDPQGELGRVRKETSVVVVQYGQS